MISIRKYLEMYRRPEPAAEEPAETEEPELAEVDIRPSLAHLAAVLVSEIGSGSLDGSDPAFGPLSESVAGIRGRLEAAATAEEIETIETEVRRVFDELRRAKDAVERRQTKEVQNMVGMLQQTIEALARGSERSVTRLRRIESQVRSASQLGEIVALRDRLRVCVDRIRDEAVAEQREFAKTRSELERDFLMARESVALARGGIPGRSQAEQRLADAPGASPLAVVLLERLPAIKARYGAGVSERYFSGFVGELMARLPAPRKAFRWNEGAVLVELPGDKSAQAGESALRDCLAGLPRSLRVDVGGRVAVLENTHRWCIVPAGAEPGEIHQRIEEFAKA
jgi:hypothetical protein